MTAMGVSWAASAAISEPITALQTLQLIGTQLQGQLLFDDLTYHAVTFTYVDSGTIQPYDSNNSYTLSGRTALRYECSANFSGWTGQAVIDIPYTVYETAAVSQWVLPWANLDALRSMTMAQFRQDSFVEYEINGSSVIEYPLAATDGTDHPAMFRLGGNYGSAGVSLFHANYEAGNEQQFDFLQVQYSAGYTEGGKTYIWIVCPAISDGSYLTPPATTAPVQTGTPGQVSGVASGVISGEAGTQAIRIDVEVQQDFPDWLYQGNATTFNDGGFADSVTSAVSDLDADAAAEAVRDLSEWDTSIIWETMGEFLGEHGLPLIIVGVSFIALFGFVINRFGL